jgi:alginate O-acetyltransferase complex protein AlgI
MSFATPTFLWYFMPATLLVYWLLPRAARNGILAGASLIFYAWGGHAFVFLLLACVAVNFTAGLALDVQPRPRRARRVEIRRLRVAPGLRPRARRRPG